MGGWEDLASPASRTASWNDAGMKAECPAMTPVSCLILLNWLYSSVWGVFKHWNVRILGLTRSAFTSVLVNSLLTAYWTIFQLWCEIFSGMLPRFYIFSITDSVWSGYNFILMRLFHQKKKSFNLKLIPVCPQDIHSVVCSQTFSPAGLRHW